MKVGRIHNAELRWIRGHRGSNRGRIKSAASFVLDQRRVLQRAGKRPRVTLTPSLLALRDGKPLLPSQVQE